MNEPMLIDIKKIHADPNQPRKIFNSKELKALSENMQTVGLINPIEVDENYQIITGERRWRAANLLSWTEIKAIVNSTKFTDYEKLRHQLSENLHQSGASQMNPMDIANGLKNMLDLMGWESSGAAPLEDRFQGQKHIQKLAKEISKSIDYIYEHLSYLEEKEGVQQDIASGTPRTFYDRASQAPSQFKEKIQDKIIKKEITTRKEVEGLVKLARNMPDVAERILQEKFTQQSAGATRILNAIVVLGLALEGLSLDQVHDREKGIVQKQLAWIKGKIEQYLGFQEGEVITESKVINV